MKTETDEKNIIKYFESRIRKHEKSPDRELWLNNLKKELELKKYDYLSQGCKHYLNTKIDDCLKR
jgi:hypothetical protein